MSVTEFGLSDLSENESYSHFVEEGFVVVGLGALIFSFNLDHFVL